MREIKFRAWIIKTQKMIDVHEIIFPSYECKMSIGSINVRPYWPPEFKLMQYTALKDKNGVAIYEGDIVKYGEYKIVHGEVFFSPQLRFGIKLGVFVESLYAFRDTVEIIGNIYENPELLKG